MPSALMVIPAGMVPLKVLFSILPEALLLPLRSIHWVPSHPTRRRSVAGTAAALKSGIDTVTVRPSSLPATGIQSQKPAILTDCMGAANEVALCTAASEGSVTVLGLPANH